MEIEIFSDYHALSQAVAGTIMQLVKSKPDATLCLAAGDTPRLAYALLAEMAAADKTSFSKCTFVGLDEWVGIPPDNQGSCHFFLQTNLFGPLAIDPSRIHLFDSLTTDLDGECRKMDTLIRKEGGIDLMLVGVGMNGHIGFNEPGVSDKLFSHVIALDETTQTVGQKYFDESTTLKSGITLGLKHFMESKKAILVASGTRKADVIRRALEEPVSTALPASVIRKHERGVVMLDHDAATVLRQNTIRGNHP